MRSALALAGVLLVHPGAAHASEAVVPDRFLGEWASDVDLCGSGADDLVLRVSRNHISRWESRGPIRAVVLLGKSEIALVSELTSEGETWLYASTFKLSDDGLRLTETSSPSGDELVRHRCAGTAASDPGQKAMED